MITVTSKDALRSEQLTPGWRDGTCVSYTPKTAAKDGSGLHVFGIEVLDNGVSFPLKDYQISEKAVSMGKAFLIACGFPKEEWDLLVKGEKTSTLIDPQSCVGKSFKVMVTNTTFNGRISNEAGDFLPAIN